MYRTHSARSPLDREGLGRGAAIIVVSLVLGLLLRSATASAGSNSHRNCVADYLMGAELQCECGTSDQGDVIKQALTDMLNEPVEALRKQRYRDYQSHPDQWTIVELLHRYFVPQQALLANMNDVCFFNDLKKPQAQKVIRAWLEQMKHPGSGHPEPTKMPL